MCKNGKEYNIETKIRRETIYNKSPEEIRYGELWAEIELPKLIGEERQ